MACFYSATMAWTPTAVDSLLGAVEGGGCVAELLIEDQQRVSVGYRLTRLGDAATEEGHKNLEHGWLPVMNVVHEHRDATIMNDVQAIF